MEREAREARERRSMASKARAARAAKTARGRAAGSPRGAKARVARAAPESRQQARTIAYSLARALRALAGGLSWERLGRIALLGNASEIRPPGAHSGPPAAHFGPPGGPWGSFWTSWAHFEPPEALLRLSWGALGSLWGASWASKSLQNRSRRLSRRPPASELDFGSILAPFWGSYWLHFGTPRTSKNVVFVWRVCHFSKKRGVRKNTLKKETWLSWNGKRAR